MIYNNFSRYLAIENLIYKMKTEFSNRMKEVFNFVREEVIRLGNENVGVEHLFLGILREGNGTAIKTIEAIGVDCILLRKSIENKIPINDKLINIQKDTIRFKRETERVLKKALMEQKTLNENEIKTIHVLLAILLDPNNIVTQSFDELHINYEMIINEYESQVSENFSSSLDESNENIDDEDDIFGPSKSEKSKIESRNSTPVLDNFGRDLTQYAIEEKLDPIVGRIKEIERVSQILSREFFY